MKVKKFSLKQYLLCFADGDAEGGASATTAAPDTASTAPADATENPDSVTVPLDMQTAPTAPPAVDWAAVIPDEFKEKDTFKNILKAENPGLELIKQLDNAQSLIGKKTAVPAADAPEEDWVKYAETVRPKTIEDYEIKPVDLGEGKEAISKMINDTRNPEFEKGVKEVFHKYGLSKWQADGIAAGFDKLSSAWTEATYQEELKYQTEVNAHFDSVAKDVFGGSKDKALEAGRKFIEDFADEKTKVFMRDPKMVSNEALMIIASLAKSVHAKYEKEDTFSGPNSGNKLSSASDLRAAMAEIQRSDDYRSSMRPGHQAAIDKVKELSAQIAKAEGLS